MTPLVGLVIIAMNPAADWSFLVPVDLTESVFTLIITQCDVK